MLPYHIGTVQSNDSIHGGSQEFLSVISEKEKIIVAKLEELLQTAGSHVKMVSMELLELIVSIAAADTVCWSLFLSVPLALFHLLDPVNVRCFQNSISARYE